MVHLDHRGILLRQGLHRLPQLPGHLGVGQAEARLAETLAEPEIVPAAGLAETDGDALAGTESVLFFIALVGVLALAGLGYALYRAV